ncbi:MAG: DUF2807 domain-containing protein, partial [Prevotellaceae bacterium]|nr:DUF2807 domain-containing protein [Prevotellaceae bacterium]
AIVIIVLIATIFGVSTGILGGLLPWTFDSVLVAHPALATTGLCLLIGVPLVSILYAIVSAIFKWKPVHKSVPIIGLILWLSSFALLICADWNWQQFRDRENWHHWGVSYFNNEIQGDGNIIKNEDFFDEGKFINNLDFRGIDFNIEFDTQSGKSGIVFIGDSNILEKIVTNTYIYGTRADAEIFPQGNSSFNPTQPIKLIVYTNKVKRINLNGSSSLNVINAFITDTIDVLCEGSGDLKFAKITADKLQIRLRGSGDIDVFTECKNSVINLNGSGDIKLNGKSVSSEFYLYGSGDIAAYNFQCDTVSTQIFGSGDIMCNASNLLKTTIFGSGDVHYKNSVKVQNLNSVGSGSIIKE